MREANGWQWELDRQGAESGAGRERVPFWPARWDKNGPTGWFFGPRSGDQIRGCRWGGLPRAKPGRVVEQEAVGGLEGLRGCLVAAANERGGFPVTHHPENVDHKPFCGSWRRDNRFLVQFPPIREPQAILRLTRELPGEHRENGEARDLGPGCRPHSDGAGWLRSRGGGDPVAPSPPSH